MKFFYILFNQFVSIYLSPMTVTTLHFENPISYCDRGVSENELGLEFRRNNTSVSLVPKTDKINSNMTCYAKNGEIFVFNLKWSKEIVHKNIVIKKAEQEKGGIKILETESFRLFDAGKNYYIENKTPHKIDVNETLVDRFGIASKWSPILINGKEYHL